MKNVLAISVLGTFLSINSRAQVPYCPELSGEYVCAQSTANPFRLRVTNVPMGSTMAYDFESSVEGRHRIFADGNPVPVQSPAGKGTLSARCERGELVTTFLLTRPDGLAFHVRDSLRRERKALVRIRLSLPTSQVKVKDVYVCRPYFPPRR